MVTRGRGRGGEGEGGGTGKEDERTESPFCQGNRALSVQCLRIFFKCKNGQFAGKFLAHQMDLGGSRQRQTYMILTTNLRSMERLQQRGRATHPGPHGHWVLQPELELSGQAPDAWVCPCPWFPGATSSRSPPRPPQSA